MRPPEARRRSAVVPNTRLKADATSPAWSRITWNAGIRTLTKVSRTASAASRRSSSHVFSIDASSRPERTFTTSTMTEDSAAAMCCRTALILAELVVSALRIASVALMMAGATSVANLLAYCSNRKPTKASSSVALPAISVLALVAVRPRSASTFSYLAIPADPMLSKRDERRPDPLAEEIDRQTGLGRAILHPRKLVGDGPEGIDGQDLAGPEADSCSGCRQAPWHFPTASSSRRHFCRQLPHSCRSRR